MKLSRLADGLTVVVAMSILIVLGMRLFARPTEPPAVTDVQLSAELGIDFAAAERTLVVVLQSDCPYCEQSKPFYGRLADEQRRGVQIAIAAPPGDTGIADYSALLDTNVVVFPDRGELPVNSTPTLLLVNGEGVVEVSWIGLLDDRREEEVVAALRRRATSSF